MKMYIGKEQFKSKMMSSPNYGTKFSSGALDVIYNDLEEMYEGEFILDIPGVCSMYREYDSLGHYNEDQFGVKHKEDYYQTFDDLRSDTTVLLIPGGGFLVMV